MRKLVDLINNKINSLLSRMNMKLRPKLILLFLGVKVIPIIILMSIALTQISNLGHTLRDLAANESEAALSRQAVESIERLTTDTARDVANFLYQRDNDILRLAELDFSDEALALFTESNTGRLINRGAWNLSSDQMLWEATHPLVFEGVKATSSNPENNEVSFGVGFSVRNPFTPQMLDVPFYDEVAFIDLAGNQVFRYVTPNTTKVNYPFSSEKARKRDGSVPIPPFGSALFFAWPQQISRLRSLSHKMKCAYPSPTTNDKNYTGGALS